MKEGYYMEQILYNNEAVFVAGSYDTVVIGAGPAGVSAGIAAAKGGCRTLIIEKGICCGGTATRGLVSPMMPSHVEHGTNFHEIEQALLQLGAPTRDNCMGYVWFNKEQMSLVLEELYIKNHGELLYDATLVDCIVDNGSIQMVLVMTVEGLIAIKAEQFIDGTGDAILSKLAQVPIVSGDEEGNNQISSLRFEMAGIQVERFREYCLSIQDHFSPLEEGYFFEAAMVYGRGFKLEPLFVEGVEEGLLEQEDLRYFQCFSLPDKPGCMSFNCPHIGDMPQNTNAFIRSNGIIHARKMIHRLVGFLQKKMPGFEHSFLMQEATMLGIRESNRIVGKYILTETDYLNRARFEDGIAQGDWYIDVHSAKKGLIHQDKFQKGEYYEIPYRCLINDKISNLITVGRCISTTFLMQASIRIIPTVIDMGQAAGMACAYGLKNKIKLSEIQGQNLGIKNI